jgi:porphobilinogen deaminase
MALSKDLLEILVCPICKAALDLKPDHVRPFTPEEMLPAPGQGALAIQTRVRDPARIAVARIDHPDSRDAFFAERRLMHELGGDCAVPLGAYATIRENDGVAGIEMRLAEREGRDWNGSVTDLLPRVIDLRAVVFDPDPASEDWIAIEVTEEHAWLAGVAAAEALLAAGAGAILERSS